MSTIRFANLQVGQQFEFRDESYTKISPLIASNNADGKQRMIPRSALVTTAEDIPREEKSPQGEEHPALEVLERYHQLVLAEINSLEADEAQTGAARARLEAQKEELARAIRRE